MLPTATYGALLYDFGAIQAMWRNQIPENKVSILLPSQVTDCQSLESIDFQSLKEYDKKKPEAEKDIIWLQQFVPWRSTLHAQVLRSS